jgi:hypothetical protein
MKKHSSKLFHTLTFLFASTALVASTAQANFRQERPGNPDRSGGQYRGGGSYVETAQVHRFFGFGHHFLTLNYSEGMNAGYRYEGVAFSVLTQPSWGTVPLFRCLVPANSDHFVSRDAGCEGAQYRNEGIYGYVMEDANSQAITAVYRCYRDGDHLDTTNPQECNAARYRVEGIQGYVQR